MVAEDESLNAIINVMSDLDQIDELIDKLIAVEALIDRIDGRRIDLNTNPAQRALTALQARMASAQLQGSMGIPTGSGDADGAAESVSRQMTNASKAAEEAAEGFGLTNLRMSDMHNALAKLVPLILVLIGALPALIGALVGLAAAAVAAAAALMALAGFGALGFAIQEAGVDNIGEGFQTLMRDIRESFLDAFAPLAERLAPLMEDALDGLDMLFQRIADRGDVLVAFGDAARDLGGFILDTFPGAIAAIGEVATAFVPVFEAIAQIIGQEDIGSGFIEFMADVLPPFADFVRLLADIIPHILGMSIGFLQVTNALMLLLDGFFVLIDILPLTNEQFGFLIGTGLALITIFAILNSQIFLMAKTALARLGLAVQSMIVGFLEMAGAANMAALAANATSVAIATLIGVATLGAGLLLAGVLGSIADQFDLLGGKIRTATDELRNFQSVSNRVSGTNPYGNAEVPERGSLSGGGRSGSVNVTVEGNADKEMVEEQTKNANFRMSRTGSTLQ